MKLVFKTKEEVGLYVNSSFTKCYSSNYGIVKAALLADLDDPEVDTIAKILLNLINNEISNN